MNCFSVEKKLLLPGLPKSCLKVNLKLNWFKVTDSVISSHFGEGFLIESTIYFNKLKEID